MSVWPRTKFSRLMQTSVVRVSLPGRGKCIVPALCHASLYGPERLTLRSGWCDSAAVSRGGLLLCAISMTGRLLCAILMTGRLLFAILMTDLLLCIILMNDHQLCALLLYIGP